MKTVILSVTNDLVTEQRVNKVAISLQKEGYEPILIGRKSKYKISKSSYKKVRLRMIFSKGAFFYIEYNLKLFFYILLKKVDILVANDLDTLLANYLLSVIKRKKLVYDTHEYFTEVPELINRRFVKNIWLAIEKFILPKIKNSYTVCKSISDIYNDKYKIDMKVIRNVPICYDKKKYLDSSPFKTDKKIIIYQGALNIGRGIEHMIEAMQYIDNAYFYIIGGGVMREKLEKKCIDLDLVRKVFFLGRINYHQLKQITPFADIGISIEENLGLNYYYSLPNKLFDYIQAHIPVLVSNFPEQKNIVNKYNIGLLIENHKPKHIADKIIIMLYNDDIYYKWKHNLIKASKELCWENENKKLIEIYKL